MSAVRRRMVAVLVAAVLVPGAVGGGSAAAQSSDLSDTPSFSTTTTPTTSTSTAPTSTSTTPTTTTTPEITAADTPKGVLLDPADRVELATSLAEATEETGVCFGYEVSLGGSGASDQDESLSSFGPDRSIASASGLTDSSTFSSGSGAAQTVTGEEFRTTCPKGALVLDVTLTYTSSSSESEDSASYDVGSTEGLTNGRSPTSRLRDLTGVDDGDLLGDQDDLALRNLAAALPLTLDDAQPAADTSTTASAQAPNGDRLTGSPGSDWIRAHGLGIGVAFGLLLLGLVLVLGGRSGRKRTTRPQGPGGLDADSGAGTSSTTTTP